MLSSWKLSGGPLPNRVGLVAAEEPDAAAMIRMTSGSAVTGGEVPPAVTVAGLTMMSPSTPVLVAIAEDAAGSIGIDRCRIREVAEVDAAEGEITKAVMTAGPVTPPVADAAPRLIVTWTEGPLLTEDATAFATRIAVLAIEGDNATEDVEAVGAATKAPSNSEGVVAEPTADAEPTERVIPIPSVALVLDTEGDTETVWLTCMAVATPATEAGLTRLPWPSPTNSDLDIP